MKTISFPDHFARARYQFERFDDFDWLISPHFWTTLVSDNGSSATVGDTEHGVVPLITGATNNNEVNVRSTNEIALFQADYAFVFETRLQYAEASTDDANICIGLADAAGADLLVDNGAGSGINSSGVLIYKVDSYSVGNLWRTIATNNAVSRTNDSAQTAGGSSYVTLRIEGKAIDATSMRFDYYLDDMQLTDYSTNRPISQYLAYASATEMRLVAGYVKAGSGTSETLSLDYNLFAATRV